MLCCLFLVGKGAYYARRWLHISSWNLLLWDPNFTTVCGENDDDGDVVEELLMTETIESTMEATEVGDMLI